MPRLFGRFISAMAHTVFRRVREGDGPLIASIGLRNICCAGGKREEWSERISSLNALGTRWCSSIDSRCRLNGRAALAVSSLCGATTLGWQEPRGLARRRGRHPLEAILRFRFTLTSSPNSSLSTGTGECYVMGMAKRNGIAREARAAARKAFGSGVLNVSVGEIEDSEGKPALRIDVVVKKFDPKVTGPAQKTALVRRLLAYLSVRNDPRFPFVHVVEQRELAEARD
jgi:hypothetical protein